MLDVVELAVCPQCEAPNVSPVIVVLPFNERVARADRRQSNHPHLIPASRDRRKGVRDRRQTDLIAQAAATAKPQMECQGCGHTWEKVAFST